jgi:hypothetical protein
MESNSNIKIYFVKYIIAEHVTFVMRLLLNGSAEPIAEHSERYSDLKQLHTLMKSEAKSSNYPHFPPKKYFGNTDPVFLNKRLTDLQCYFDTIFASEEFRKLPSLKTWLNSILVRNNANIQERQLQPEQIDKGHLEVRSPKDIVDDAVKRFVDISSDSGPNVDKEDMRYKEQVYGELMKKTFNSEGMRRFSIQQNEADKFDQLGVSEAKIKTYDTILLNKVQEMVLQIKQNIPINYAVSDLIIEF